jgi:hypothetical protein
MAKFPVPFFSLVLLAAIAASAPFNVLAASRGMESRISAVAAAGDLTGTWSGSFYSNHANVPPFTMTVAINPDSRGHLIGRSTLNSECLKGAQLQVTVTDSNVVLAGSDEQGDNITVRGTLDGSGTLMKASYILNGSATGRCETDNGTGNLSKR